MKKTLLTLGALSLAFAAPFAAPSPATAEPVNSEADIIQLCLQLIEIFPEFSLGECVAYAQSNEAALPAQACNAIRDFGNDQGFRNQGECIAYYRELLD